MTIQKLTFLLVVASLSQSYSFGQTKSQIIEQHIEAFNKRDIEGYLAPLDDSVRGFKFPDQLSEKSKSEFRKVYTSAFASKELGGQLKVIGRMEIGDIFIIEQSLQRGDFQPVDQYVLFRFSGDRIIEIHYLPKNFSWPKAVFDR